MAMAMPSLPPKEYLDSDRLNFLVWRYVGDLALRAMKHEPNCHFRHAFQLPVDMLCRVAESLGIFAFSSNDADTTYP